MPAANTYTQIASTTVATAGVITFSSIPGTYTDLILVVNGFASADGQISLRFNGATTNYSSTFLTADGTSAGSTRETATTYMQLGYYDRFNTSTNSTAICQIMNYANTTTFKTVLARMNNTSYGVGASVGLWRATPVAITSVQASAAGNNFAVGTTASLYGITAA